MQFLKFSGFFLITSSLADLQSVYMRKLIPDILQAKYERQLDGSKKEFSGFEINPHYGMTIAEYRIFIRFKKHYADFSTSEDVFDILF